MLNNKFNNYLRLNSNLGQIKIILLVFFMWFSSAIIAQPFRYIRHDTIQRDSIKLLKIKGYREYIAPINDTSKRHLKKIVLYDLSGNQIRHCIIDTATGNQNQESWKYSAKNLLLEHSLLYPDSLTLTQRTIYQRNNMGKDTMICYEYYHEGKLGTNYITVKSYDAQGNCIEQKDVYPSGKFSNHFKYKYDVMGNKYEETAFYENDKVQYTRRVEIRKDEQAIGFPSEKNIEITELLKEKTIINRDGSKITENGYDIRWFNSKNIELKWIEKHYQVHWFEYIYY